MSGAKSVRSVAWAGIGVALLVFLSPLWLFSALAIVSPSHAATYGVNSGRLTAEEAIDFEIEHKVHRAPRGPWSSILHVVRRYHLGLGALVLWSLLPFARWLGRFDPHSLSCWAIYVLVAACPTAVLGFVGYRLADQNQDLLHSVAPSLATRPRVAGALLGVALGMLWGGFRVFRAGHSSPESSQPELGEPSVEEPERAEDTANLAPNERTAAEFAVTERLPEDVASGLVEPDHLP